VLVRELNALVRELNGLPRDVNFYRGDLHLGLFGETAALNRRGLDVGMRGWRRTGDKVRFAQELIRQ